jgi:hypothetical protein
MCTLPYTPSELGYAALKYSPIQSYMLTHTLLQTGDRERAMAAFRGYLESRAADLANNQDLATYFALPYVPDLSKHPTFKNLFLVCIVLHYMAISVYNMCIPL